MNDQRHWDGAYVQKGATSVSWYRPHLDLSLDLIRQAAPSREAAIIDVGGGAATLVDDLLADGYRDLSVLDIAPEALALARSRLGAAGDRVAWIVGDITRVALLEAHYDLWHDRAVFHFLTAGDARRRYVATVLHAVRPGGAVIVATFAPDGPERCSGLPVARYDAASLHREFGAPFELLDSRRENHLTPAGKQQRFVYCFCRRR
jgi:SAM-dependent methyltransferase